jgi:hypothetical protein
MRNSKLLRPSAEMNLGGAGLSALHLWQPGSRLQPLWGVLSAGLRITSAGKAGFPGAVFTGLKVCSTPKA